MKNLFEDRADAQRIATGPLVRTEACVRIDFVLIRMSDLKAIAGGELSLAFRRWKRPTVKAGGTLRTPIGVLAIDGVERVDEAGISESDARRAGFESRRELLAELRRRPDGQLYRIELRLSGADPRIELRSRAKLTKDEVSEIGKRLDRFDKASPQGAWTARTMRLIADRPATRAADLATTAGFETRWFKTKVRKLKELGLTESLEVGYELSPRGKAYLGANDREADRRPDSDTAS